MMKLLYILLVLFTTQFDSDAKAELIKGKIKNSNGQNFEYFIETESGRLGVSLENLINPKTEFLGLSKVDTDFCESVRKKIMNGTSMVRWDQVTTSRPMYSTGIFRIYLNDPTASKEMLELIANDLENKKIESKFPNLKSNMYVEVKQIKLFASENSITRMSNSGLMEASQVYFDQNLKFSKITSVGQMYEDLILPYFPIYCDLKSGDFKIEVEYEFKGSLTYKSMAALSNHEVKSIWLGVKSRFSSIQNPQVAVMNGLDDRENQLIKASVLLGIETGKFLKLKDKDFDLTRTSADLKLMNGLFDNLGEKYNHVKLRENLDESQLNDISAATRSDEKIQLPQMKGIFQL